MNCKSYVHQISKASPMEWRGKGPTKVICHVWAIMEAHMGGHVSGVHGGVEKVIEKWKWMGIWQYWMINAQSWPWTQAVQVCLQICIMWKVSPFIPLFHEQRLIITSEYTPISKRHLLQHQMVFICDHWLKCCCLCLRCNFIIYNPLIHWKWLSIIYYQY